MSIEIASTNGLFQFRINEHQPREVLVRRNKLGAHWRVYRRCDSTDQAIATLLAAKDDESAMIRVTVEILPFGIEYLAKELHVIEIANDRSGDKDTGNYHVREWGDRGIINGRIEGHNRADGALVLARKAIEAVSERDDSDE